MNRSEPLTPEERALARLLGRTAPNTPSAALDEAVLAAARAAVQPQPTVQGGAASAAHVASPGPNAPRRARSRLPAALGLAASVVFAVGIAWQLKPEPPQPPAVMEAAPPASAAMAPSAPAEERADAAAAEALAADTTTAALPAPVVARSSADAAQKAAPVLPAPAPRAHREPVADAPAQAAPVLTPPMPAPAPAPAVAAAPAAERYAMDVAEPRAAATGSGERARLNAAQVRSAPTPAATNPAPSAGAPGVMRRAAPRASGALSASAVDAAVAADAALPRKQWLKRIRERRDAGDLDTARASLEHYLQQYPEARVPRDIRQLLDN